jgi:serine/threonine protein phosphatase PrpC
MKPSSGRANLSYDCRSDKGIVRKNNEDRVRADPARGIFIVIDGVGGQAAGEIAADEALKVLCERLERQSGNAEERLREGITLANNHIFKLSRTREECAGMACVLTAAVIEGERVTVGHVGDTRLYLLRPDSIRKLTFDHSPVGEKEDRGEISEEAAMRHPRRNEVYRDVGSEMRDEDEFEFIDIIRFDFPPDAALLFCSDGLTDLVRSADILRIIEDNAKSPTRIIDGLINAANDAGGKDNVSVIFVAREDYASSVKSHRGERGGRGAGRHAERGPDNAGHYRRVRQIGRLVVSRWAMLIYGLLIGMTLAKWYLFQQPASTNLAAPGGKTFEVAKSGNPHFNSIAEALKQANPGDTIKVAPGTYPESFVLKDGVHLISAAPREAVIQFPADAQSDAAIIATKIKNARLTGFRILGGERMSYGIRLTEAQVEIDDVEIEGARLAAIEILASTESSLRASFLHNNPGAGVLIKDRATPRIVHNHIVDNGQASNRAGIESLGGSRPILAGNVIKRNTGGAIQGEAVTSPGEPDDKGEAPANAASRQRSDKSRGEK